MVITRSCHAANFSSKIWGIYSCIDCQVRVSPIGKSTSFLEEKQKKMALLEEATGKEPVNYFRINRNKDFLLVIVLF